MSIEQALAEGAEITETLARGGLSLIESSVLGAVTAVAVAIAVLSVRKLSRVQDARARDLERQGERMEAVMVELTRALSDLSGSLDNLARAEREGQALLSAMKSSIDLVVMEAMRERGVSTRPRSNA
jgi:hypothetical protein